MKFLAQLKGQPLADLLQTLDSRHRVKLVDVGSIGGLKGRWAALDGRVDAIGFDPREKGESVRENDGRVVYPFAVGDRAGTKTLYVTQFGNMSSTLEPNADVLGKYVKWQTYGAIKRRLTLDVVPIDQLLSDDVDAVKVDTQGSELEILAGAENLMARALLLAEIEVSIIERYRGQPLLGDVAAFMKARGFDLIDLYQQRRYYAANSFGLTKVKIDDLGSSGQLAYGDAIFFLSPDKLAEMLERRAESAPRIVVNALLLLLIYGKVDLAAALFDKHRAAMWPADAEAFVEWLNGKAPGGK